MMLDIDAAREWLRDHLSEGEPVELLDESVLDRAAAIIRVERVEQKEVA